MYISDTQNISHKYCS